MKGKSSECRQIWFGICLLKVISYSLKMETKAKQLGHTCPNVILISKMNTSCFSSLKRVLGVMFFDIYMWGMNINLHTTKWIMDARMAML